MEFLGWSFRDIEFKGWSFWDRVSGIKNLRDRVSAMKFREVHKLKLSSLIKMGHGEENVSLCWVLQSMVKVKNIAFVFLFNIRKLA